MEMEGHIKKISSALLFLALLLGSCSCNIITTEQTKTAVTASATSTPESTEIVVPAREAVLSEINDNVSARVSSNEDFASAIIGMHILPSGGVETGIDGRARLDMLPEGTIVRVGPNSIFTVSEITEVYGEPKTTIELVLGKVYILLSGGSLDVKTPTGMATVRGSLLSVEYDPEKNIVKAACLDGHCALENEAGENIELTTGEFSYIENGHPPIPPEQIDRKEIQEWLDEIPELKDFLDELPNPEDFPESIPVPVEAATGAGPSR